MGKRPRCRTRRVEQTEEKKGIEQTGGKEAPALPTAPAPGAAEPERRGRTRRRRTSPLCRTRTVCAMPSVFAAVFFLSKETTNTVW
jgi:hypothetical protein